MALERSLTHGDKSLRRVLGKTAAWSTLDVVLGRFGQFVQGVVVARIVAPRDFGVFAVALVVHAIVINVSELGVSAALIREDPARTARSAPTVATVSLLNSGALAIMMVALSSPLATALGSPKAAAPIAVMALTLPIAGLTAVPSALLKRDFRMDRIFWADFANMLVTGVVVVVLALHGWGALALAWSWVAGQVATAVILLSYSAGRYRPGWRSSEARRLLAFGIPLAGANLLAFLVLNVDYIVVGRLLGPAALGLYLLAFNVSGWPFNVFGAVIRSVSLPGFSRLRLQDEALPEHFVRALRLVAGITLPVCFTIGALADPLVNALYGKRWSAAASALVGLSVLGAGRILLELSGDFLVSLGRTRAVMVAQLPWLISLTAALIFVAPRYGIGGVGAAQAFVVLVVMLPVYGRALRRSGVNVGAAARVLLAPLAWGLLAAAGAYTVSSRIGSPFFASAAGGCVGLGIGAIPYARVIARRLRSILRAIWTHDRLRRTTVSLTGEEIQAPARRTSHANTMGRPGQWDHRPGVVSSSRTAIPDTRPAASMSILEDRPIRAPD